MNNNLFEQIDQLQAEINHNSHLDVERHQG